MKAVLNIRHGARFRQFFRVLTTFDAETEAFSEDFDFVFRSGGDFKEPRRLYRMYEIRTQRFVSSGES